MNLRITPPGTGLALALLTLALITSACSGSSTTTLVEQPGASTNDSQAVVAPTRAPAPAATIGPAPEPTAAAALDQEPDTESEPEPEPTPDTVFWGSEIAPGDCIERIEGNPPFTPPTILACDDFHEEEIYAKAILDDPASAPYPGTEALSDRVASELCDQATIDFGGEPWDVLPFSTAVLFPTEIEWEAGDRTVMCSAGPAEGVAFKIGSAAGGTIDSDDLVVARTSYLVDDVNSNDWMVVGELDTLTSAGSLTNGQFALPLRRPFQVEQGFIFNANSPGSDEHANSTWGYSWSTGEITDLGSILPNYELASTSSAGGVTVFAARATPDDGWDLWIAADGEASELAAGAGDQQFPTITPDLQSVVFQDGGDIWVVDIDDSNLRQLTSGPANDWENSVSPDGQTVIFSSDRSGNDDIWAVDIDGGEPRNLTNHPGDDIWPFFNADGSLIYFSSDRLDPIDDRSKLMVMNTDGTNQSWFSAVNASQGFLIDDAVADQVKLGAPTLSERFDYELITGEPGAISTWNHSSGRLSVELPVGWRVGEITDDTGFLAGPRPDRYLEVWEADGVLVVLYEGESSDEFFAHYDESQIVQACEQFDGSDGVGPIGGGIDGLAGNFDCGDGAVGGVLAFYNGATQVGVIIEGQRDNLPNADDDSVMLTAIARSLIWE